MKFGNHFLRKVENVEVGDTVCFNLPSASYIVLDIERTEIGMIRHRHKGGSSAYWPGELLYVEDSPAPQEAP
jgi:hypothetical protein